MRYNGNMEVCTPDAQPLPRPHAVGRGLWPAPDARGMADRRQGRQRRRVLSALGVEARAVCPLGGETGARFRELAKKEGVDVLPVDVPAPTRVIDTGRARRTLPTGGLPPGAPLTEKDLDHLEDKLFSALPGARVLAVCGLRAGRGGGRARGGHFAAGEGDGRRHRAGQQRRGALAGRGGGFPTF